MRTNQAASLFCAYTGLMVLLGGWVSPELLRAGVEGHVGMKPFSCAAFVLCAPILYWLHSSAWPQRLARGVCGVALLVLVCAALVAPVMLDRFNSLLLPDEPNPVATPYPGVPSLLTIAQFAAIAVFGLRRFRWRHVVGWAFAVVSALVLIGHATGIELLTGHVPGWSGGQAIPSAVLFAVVGLFGLRPCK